eukprot:776588_1
MSRSTLALTTWRTTNNSRHIKLRFINNQSQIEMPRKSIIWPFGDGKKKNEMIKTQSPEMDSDEGWNEKVVLQAKTQNGSAEKCSDTNTEKRNLRLQAIHNQTSIYFLWICMGLVLIISTACSSLDTCFDDYCYAYYDVTFGDISDTNKDEPLTPCGTYCGIFGTAYLIEKEEPTLGDTIGADIEALLNPCYAYPVNEEEATCGNKNDAKNAALLETCGTIGTAYVIQNEEATSGDNIKTNDESLLNPCGIFCTAYCVEKEEAILGDKIDADIEALLNPCGTYCNAYRVNEEEATCGTENEPNNAALCYTCGTIGTAYVIEKEEAILGDTIGADIEALSNPCDTYCYAYPVNEEEATCGNKKDAKNPAIFNTCGTIGAAYVIQKDEAIMGDKIIKIKANDEQILNPCGTYCNAYRVNEEEATCGTENEPNNAALFNTGGTIDTAYVIEKEEAILGDKIDADIEALLNPCGMHCNAYPVEHQEAILGDNSDANKEELLTPYEDQDLFVGVNVRRKSRGGYDKDKYTLTNDIDTKKLGQPLFPPNGKDLSPEHGMTYVHRQRIMIKTHEMLELLVSYDDEVDAWYEPHQILSSKEDKEEDGANALDDSRMEIMTQRIDDLRSEYNHYRQLLRMNDQSNMNDLLRNDKMAKELKSIDMNHADGPNTQNEMEMGDEITETALEISNEQPKVRHAILRSVYTGWITAALLLLNRLEDAYIAPNNHHKKIQNQVQKEMNIKNELNTLEDAYVVPNSHRQKMQNPFQKEMIIKNEWDTLEDAYVVPNSHRQKMQNPFQKEMIIKNEWDTLEDAYVVPNSHRQKMQNPVQKEMKLDEYCMKKDPYNTGFDMMTKRTINLQHACCVKDEM